MGRVWVVGFLLASSWVHQWSTLRADWQPYLLVGIAIALGMAYVWRHYKGGVFVSVLIAFMLFGLWNTQQHALAAQQQVLRLSDQNKAYKLRLEIQSLPRLNTESRSFIAKVLEAKPEGVPEYIQVHWSASEWRGPYAAAKPADFPELLPGQQWQLTAFLKSPHGTRNPAAFDYEAYALAQGMYALAQVRGQPQLIHTQPLRWTLPLLAQRWRAKLRAAMLPYLQGYRWGGVILALTIGDQASIDAEDWLVFNRTGLTHLVSISGTHVTLLASLCAVVVAWCWRRLRLRQLVLAEWLPAQLAAGYVALVVAALYSLTAGWEVPARRTFTMFSVAVLSLAWRLPLSITQIIAVAALLIVAADPWALFASGFWLSFGAVLVLVACAAWSGQVFAQAKGSKLLHKVQQFYQAAQWQLIISVALLPILAFLFFEMSLVSPLSNAYAITLMGMIATPLALLFALLSLSSLETLTLWVLAACHGVLDLTMWPTQWLAHWSVASVGAARAPLWAIALALAGIGVALWPRALPGAYLGWVLILPAVLWRSAAIDAGEWRLHSIDVGQGSALLIETHSTYTLFDTGLRSAVDQDAGRRYIVPYLNSLGLNQLNTLVLSHADLDHVGGTRSVLEALPVQQAFSSFDLLSYMKRESQLLKQANLPPLPLSMQRCERGHSWTVDGVEFRFVWPIATKGTSIQTALDKNAQSCVLQVTGRYARLLLAADIGAAEEKQLIEAGLAQQDLVVVGHHGSRSSSSAAWVQALKAQVAIAQVGWWNRFAHPHDEVIQRWQNAGTDFYRTDHDGAVVVHSTATGLQLQSERRHRPRYWQNAWGAQP